MTAEVRKYITYVLWRIWIALAVALVFGAAAYWFFDRQPPVYQARSHIFIGGSTVLANPSVNAISEGIRLAPTYAEFVEFEPTLQAIIDELDLDMSTRSLSRMISTRIIIDTSILAINVQGANRDQVSDIANAAARQLIEFSPSNLSTEELRQLDLLQEQINQGEDQIPILIDQANDILIDISDAQEAENDELVDQLTTDYNLAIDLLNNARSVLTQAVSEHSALSNRLNRLQIVELATTPSEAARRNPLIFAVIGMLAGGGLGVAGLLLYFEYVDTRLRTEKETVRVLDLPILGSIKNSYRLNWRFNRGFVAEDVSHSRIAEGYRTVQTNLLFSPDRTPSEKMFLIASPSKNEGRTFTAANLAMVVAESGLRVLLIDADLREPKLHTLFNASNEGGLLEISTRPATNDDFQTFLKTYTQETNVPTLDLITSGTSGGNTVLPAQIFGSERFKNFINCLHQDDSYDVIFIDTPAALSVADTYMIAGAAKAEILLLLQAAQTSQEKAVKTRDQFHHIGTRIRGSILNRV